MRSPKAFLVMMFFCSVLIFSYSIKQVNSQKEGLTQQGYIDATNNLLHKGKMPSWRLTLSVWDVITYEGGENAQSITGGNGYLDIWLTNIPTDCDYDLFLYNGNYDLIDSSTNGLEEDEHIYRKISPWEYFGQYIIIVRSWSGYDPYNFYHLYATYPDTLQPDLVILNLFPSNSNPDAGDYIDVTAIVKNQGKAQATGFETDLFFDRSSMPQAPAFGNMWDINQLDSGQTESVIFHNVTSYSTGTWHMYSLADANGMWDDYGNEEERVETNNGFGPVNVYWRSPSAKPDLIVEKVEVSSYCPHVSETLYAYVTILNQGNINASGWFPTSIYYNADILHPPRPCWGCYGNDYEFSNGLAVDSRVTFTFAIPYNQAFGDVWNMYIVVDSDSSIRELNEGNNVYGPLQIQWDGGFFRRGPITRDQIIENAMSFTTIEWICPPVNDTIPRECSQWRSNYVVGQTYYGEAYKWTGSAKPSCFYDDITQRHKRAGALGVSSYCHPPDGGYPWASGIECCGLVWQSFNDDWHSTENLDQIGFGIPGGLDYLIKGDYLLSKALSHTYIFDSWAGDTMMNVIEAANFLDIDPDGSSEARLLTRGISYYSSYMPYKYMWTQEITNYNPNHAGDANSSGKVDIADIVYLVNYLFKHGLYPHPIWRGDANGSCTVDVADTVYLVNYLFKSGEPPCRCEVCSGRNCNYP
jgi:hypothetical protein